MGKLKILSAKQVCKILSQHGFMQVRQRGSHIIMQKQIQDSTITIPIPNYKQIPIGTLSKYTNNFIHPLIVKIRKMKAYEFKTTKQPDSSSQ